MKIEHHFYQPKLQLALIFKFFGLFKVVEVLLG